MSRHGEIVCVCDTAKITWGESNNVTAGDYRYLFTKHFCVLNFTLLPDVEEILKLAHMKVIELLGKSAVDSPGFIGVEQCIESLFSKPLALL